MPDLKKGEGLDCQPKYFFVRSGKYITSVPETKKKPSLLGVSYFDLTIAKFLEPWQKPKVVKKRYMYLPTQKR